MRSWNLYQWYEKGSDVPPFKSGPSSSLGPTVIQSFKVLPFILSILNIWSPEKVVMVRKMKGTFEFDQQYKQTENKMQITFKTLFQRYH